MLSQFQITVIVVSLFTVPAVACTLLLYFIYLVMDKANGIWSQRIREGQESAVTRIGEELERDAHLFSESPEVFTALIIIGRQIQRDHVFSACFDREAWRYTMEEQNSDES